MYEFIRNDIAILQAIQEDTLVPPSQAQISERANVSKSSVNERLRSLRDAGIIRNWSAVLQPRAVGIQIIALVGIVLRQHDRETLLTLENAITNSLKFPEILECYSLTGEYDYLLKVAVPDIDKYAEFIHDKLVPLNVISSLNSHIILREVLVRTKLPLDHIRPSGKVQRSKKEGAAASVSEC
jgi:Lrp/AsnC family leucine-responsive transcriptional regulator